MSPQKEGKNIVVCCDGTSNEYGSKNTNVVKLFSMLERNLEQQRIFYDPGVGTFSVSPTLTKIARGFLKLLGLAFGLGITQNVCDAYLYLMKNYQKGDRVYLFGFSRGAYTARAVAALLHKCGLLFRHNENLIPYAIRMFKYGSQEDIWEGFKRTFSQPCPVHFIGLWDTVTSVGWVYDPMVLPYTTNNPDISIIRHAISIDERRAFFRQNLFGNKFEHDMKQVWFAGTHCDVGGSHPPEESGLSQIALEWIVVEAQKHDLLIDKKTAEKIFAECPPDYKAQLHRSLKWYWWPCEIWPKLRADPKRNFQRRPYFNLGRRRSLPKNSMLHETVIKRRDDISEYKPKNLPADYTVEPWERFK